MLEIILRRLRSVVSQAGVPVLILRWITVGLTVINVKVVVKFTTAVVVGRTVVLFKMA